MITENRVDNGSFPIPKLLIDKGDIVHFMEEFKGFHAQFADCFSRKGNASVRVSRQYCGNVGKVENCQVGVYAVYASRHGYGFLDTCPSYLSARAG